MRRELDGACKTFKTDIIAERAIHDAAPQFAWLPLGDTIVIGRAAAAPIFALAGDADFAEAAGFKNWRRLHDTMIAAHAQRRFAQAAAVAERLAEELPSQWGGFYRELEARYLLLAERGAARNEPLVWTLDSK